MDGIARPIGGSSTFKWANGKTYELRPLTMRDWGTIEHEWVKKTREAKLATVAALYGQLPEPVWRAEFEHVKKECVSLKPAFDDIQRWIDEDHYGITFTMWLALHKDYPGEFDLEDMNTIIVKMAEEGGLKEMLDARDQANGLDQAGN